MKKGTPAAQAHIDLIHITMNKIELHARELVNIERITEEQHKIITEALDKLGDTISRELDPDIKEAEKRIRQILERERNKYHFKNLSQ